ncbi:MAG: hypothetical protein K2N06_11305 [Oscillospiraceae bacterium]|nr:hypothetical protein [Oscillospiraceae bacterium]
MKSKTFWTTKKRIVIIVGAVLLVAYLSFCIVDCVRLRKSARYTQPLITLSIVSDSQEGYSYYYGLGYKVKYSIPKFAGEENGIIRYDETGNSAEFSWLGIPIWGWWL